MSGPGSPDLDLSGCAGFNVTVVASSWHTRVMDGLLAGAERALDAAGVTQRNVLRVPGAFELPLGAQAAARDGADVVVALGVVIRGGTPHFEYVCDAATQGLVRVGLDASIPVGFGLLTCDNEAQALDRAGLEGSAEDKGFEAAASALVTARTLGVQR
jgi:6,7-dimethyl-8-ribityllumazine synthase